MKNKGFTLIELLVVIAIIGILSGTVIVSMSGAQNSAKDARVKASMDQLRATAEIHRLVKNTYVGFTDAGTDGAALVADITSQVPGSFVPGVPTITAYCMSVVLNSGTSLCMDSAGRVNEETCTLISCE
jgi:prepilin-type N-terminal cleavage/methylation domain-containing protein